MIDDDEAREILEEGAKQLGLEMEEGCEVKALYLNEDQMKCLISLTRGERTSIAIRSAFTGISIAAIIIFIVGGGYGWLTACLGSSAVAVRSHYYRKQWIQMRDELMFEIRKTEHTVVKKESDE
jgi:hypothetical protein